MPRRNEAAQRRNNRNYYWRNRMRRLAETGCVLHGARSKRWLPIEGYYLNYYYRGMIKLGESRKEWTGICFRLPTKNLDQYLTEDPLSKYYQYAMFYPFLADSYKNIYSQIDILLNQAYWYYGTELDGKELAFKLQKWNQKYMSLLHKRYEKINHIKE